MEIWTPMGRKWRKNIAGGSEVENKSESTLYNKSRILLKLSYFSQIDILDKEDIYYDIQYLSQGDPRILSFFKMPITHLIFMKYL